MTLEPVNIKRQAIIEAATQMFLKYGFKASSMDKIAQAAPVSKATLYNHFDSKDALLIAVIENLCLNLFQVVDEVTIDYKDIESSLKKIAIAFVDLIFAKEALEIYRLIIAECRDFPTLAQLIYDSAPQIVMSQLINYFKQLNQLEYIDIQDADFAADAFTSMLKGDWHFQCLLGIRNLPSEEEKTQLIEQVVTAFLRGFVYANP